MAKNCQRPSWPIAKGGALVLVTSSFRLGHLDNTNFDYIVVGAGGGGLRPGRRSERRRLLLGTAH